MIQYIMKYKRAGMCNIFKRLPFYDLKKIFQKSSKPLTTLRSLVGLYSERKTKNEAESTSFCFHFFDLQLSLSYFTFICVLLFLYSSFINFCFLFFRFLAFLCFILLYFLLTNDLRGAAPEPIIPNIPLTRSVNVGLIASRIHVS